MSSLIMDQAVLNPARRTWTREEFERAGEIGLFGPEERLELIDGEVFEKMPQNSPHATAISLVAEALRRAVPESFYVRVQLPLALDERSQPDPDVAVVPGGIRDYAIAHPTSASLVIEVSDSSLNFDRTAKAGLYARAGIEEYWIVNLQDRVLEVHQQPFAQADRPLGHCYRSVRRVTAEEQVSAMLPGVTARVADLLP